jgi:hypothetical protein
MDSQTAQSRVVVGADGSDGEVRSCSSSGGGGIPQCPA